MYGSLSPLHKKNPALFRGWRRGRKRHLKICWIRKNNTRVQKEKRKFRRRLFTTFIIHERRHFPVVFVQWPRRNVQKSVMHVHSCGFCLLDLAYLPFSLPSPSSDLKVPHWIRVRKAVLEPILYRSTNMVSGVRRNNRWQSCLRDCPQIGYISETKQSGLQPLWPKLPFLLVSSLSRTATQDCLWRKGDLCFSFSSISGRENV